MCLVLRLEKEAGIHATVFGLHRKLSKRFPFAIYYRIEESVIARFLVKQADSIPKPLQLLAIFHEADDAAVAAGHD